MKKLFLSVLSIICISMVATPTLQAQCYTPLYDNATNLIPDPEMTDLSLYGGWGAKSLDADNTFCGDYSTLLFAENNGCKAALDVPNIAWAANTSYRVRAMIKSVDGKLGMRAAQTDPTFDVTIPQTGDAWIQLDTVFTTGSNPGVDFISFNTCDNGADAMYSYVDNWELYAIPSSEAHLAKVELSTGIMEPAFNYETTSYTVTLQPGTTDVTVTTTPMRSDALIDGNDAPVDVSSGAATSTITVYAPDGVSSLEYTINYTVLEVSTDATLFSLELSDSYLKPSFNPDVLEYTVIVSSEIPSLTLTPTPNHEAAFSDPDETTIDLSLGSTSVDFMVTAEDGTNQLTYTVNILVDDQSCFTQLYPAETNLISDPHMNDMDNFVGGWGKAGIFADPNLAYCGVSYGIVGWGSIVYNVTGLLQPNTSYRSRLMVKTTPEAVTNNEAQLGMNGYIPSAEITVKPTVAEEWAPVDLAFTTGATMADQQIIFFMKADSSLMDNWELYAVPDYEASLGTCQISTGDLTPGFNPDITSYTSTLVYGTTTITPDVTAMHQDATISGNSEVDVSSGIGTSTILVTAADGSTQKTYTIEYTVSTTTDVSDIKPSTVKIYPTITNDGFNVAFKDALGMIKVYNLTGQLVYQKQAQSQIENIQLNVSSGIFVVVVESNGTKTVEKVVKTK